MYSGDEHYGDDITSGPGAADDDNEILSLIRDMPEDDRREVYALADEDDDNDEMAALRAAWECVVSRKGRTND